jgi:hypothetical protein
MQEATHGKQQDHSKQQDMADASFILGSAIIVFIASLLIISSLLFAAGRPISQYNFWLAAAVTAGATWLLCGRYFPGRRWLALSGVLAFLAAISLLGIYVCGKYYDLSWDGQAYHQEAIIQLANGWNPLRDQPLTTPNSLWINHYAKGPWIASAVLYAATGHIEQAKVFNLLLIAASFFLCLSALTAYWKKTAGPLLCSLLAAANPVSVVQSLSFYNDGQLASMLVITAALLYLSTVKKSAIPPAMLALALAIAVNIKFTALAYILVICTTVLCFLYLKKRMQLTGRIASALAVGLITGVLLVGLNPYVTNTVRKGHPFYPLAGRGAVDIVTANSPQNFHTMNRFAKLFVSTFSATGNPAGEQQTRWKWPFTVSDEELGAIWLDDRAAGFGPLFGGTLLLSPILLTAAWRADRQRALSCAGLGLLITCSALVNPEAWWARYVPQLWLLPVICVMTGLSVNRKACRLLALSIVLVLGLNLCLVSFSFFGRLYDGNLHLKSQLAGMRVAGPILVQFQSYGSHRVRLDEAGIRYMEVDSLKDPGVENLAFSDTRYRED